MPTAPEIAPTAAWANARSSRSALRWLASGGGGSVPAAAGAGSGSGCGGAAGGWRLLALYFTAGLGGTTLLFVLGPLYGGGFAAAGAAPEEGEQATPAPAGGSEETGG